MSASRPDAGVVSRSLAFRVADLCQRLLPDGWREGQEWVGGPPGARVRVHLAGRKAGVWAVFASGESGDALDLVAHLEFGGNKKSAYHWALDFLGMSGAEPPAATARPVPAAALARATREVEDTKRRALGFWLHAQPLIGTPAAAYLAGRGIGPQDLRWAPSALRFHPEVWCAETNTKLPAMLGLIQCRSEPVAVHRTYLAQRADGSWGKAHLSAAKKVLGSYRGGLIPLSRGGSKKPLRDHPEDRVLAIAEGIEDGLTVALHQPSWRVVAAISVGNMQALELPPGAIDIVLVFDRDGENPAVRKARKAAMRKLLEGGRSVRTIQPDPGFKDFNDQWQAMRAAKAAA